MEPTACDVLNLFLARSLSAALSIIVSMEHMSFSSHRRPRIGAQLDPTRTEVEENTASVAVGGRVRKRGTQKPGNCARLKPSHLRAETVGRAGVTGGMLEKAPVASN